MKQVKRWRYYCDHCKKAGGSKHHMRKHEERCTMNPNRVCGMCRMLEEVQSDIGDMIAAIGPYMPHSDWGDEALCRLRDSANGCPACMLAAIRQANVTYTLREEWGPDYWFPNKEEQVRFHFKFDFKKEAADVVRDFYDMVNEEAMLQYSQH